MKNQLFKKGVKAGIHRIGEGKERMVRIRSIVSPQESVNEKKVKSLKRFTKNMPGTPTVSHLGNGVFVAKDGNHRLNAALAQGKRKVLCKVQKLASKAAPIQLASAAWQRKEGKSESGGLNRKGVASYRRENPGSKLKTAVTTPPSKLDPDSKPAKRRKSFCARMSGMEGPMKKPNGEPTRKALSLRKWNCASALQPIRFASNDLQPHQRRVVRRIQDPSTPGLVLVHGLGSGKTRTAIESHKALGGDADVVVPAALQGNYAKELEKWGADPARSKIQSHQRAAMGKERLSNNLLIVDEGHRARNPKTGLSEAIKASASRKRLILSGTPVYNNPSDIATLVNQAAGKPVLREGKAFENRYTRPNFIARWRGERLSHSGELKKVLNKYVDYHKGDPSMLPEVTSKTIPVEMTKHQSALYRASMGSIPKGMKLDLKNIERLKPYLTGPRQVSNTARALDPSSGDEPKIDRAFRDLEGHLKDPKGKALVYSNWLEHGIKPMQQRLTAAKIPHGIFTGNEPMKQRNQTVRDYNEGRHRALLVSSSGAEGLDLKGTRMVQVLEPHFNNAKIRQVVGRSARMGSHAALSPEDRRVEVRSYVGRPKNRFFPGYSKGVEDLLNDSARDKDEVARQITRLLSSKMKTIRFDRPIEARTKASQKRAASLLRGSAWESDPELRAVRKAVINKADPVYSTGGKKESRVKDIGGRQYIEDNGVLRGGGKVGSPHLASDWRDTEGFRKAVAPKIQRDIDALQGTSPKATKSRSVSEREKIQNEGIQRLKNKLAMPAEKIRTEAMTPVREELAKELATRKEIKQTYARKYGAAKVPSKVINQASDNLAKLIPAREEKFKAASDKLGQKLMDKVRAHVASTEGAHQGWDESKINTRTAEIMQPILKPPAPKGFGQRMRQGSLFDEVPTHAQQATAEAKEKLAGILGRRTEDVDRLRANLHSLKNTGGEQTQRKIKRSLIRSGEVFKTIAEKPPEMPRFRTDLATYPRLKKIGIGAGILGAGYLATKLLKKQEEPRKQLMSSRLRLIRFGWKSNAYVDKLLTKAGKMPQSPIEYARTELAHMMKQERKVAQRIAPRVSDPGFERHERIVMRRSAERRKPDIKISSDWEARKAASEKARREATPALPDVLDKEVEKRAAPIAQKQIEKIKASEAALREKQRNEYAIAREHFTNETNEKVKKIQSGVRRKIAIGTGAGLIVGGAGGYASRRPEYATEFSSKFSNFIRAERPAEPGLVKKLIAKFNGLSTGAKVGYVTGAAAGGGVVPGSGLAGAAVGHNVEKLIKARPLWIGKKPGIIPVKQPLPAREDIYQRKFAAKPFLIHFSEKKLSPAATMGISAGLTGALVGGIPAALQRRTSIRKIGKAGAIGAALAGGLGGASALIGNKVLGDPIDGENAPYTKRGAIGGAIGGTVLGAAAGAFASKTKLARKWMSANRAYAPLVWARKSGPAGAAVLGAIGGGGYGLYQGIDEGSGVDALHGSKTKRMSSRTIPIQFARGDRVFSLFRHSGKMAPGPNSLLRAINERGGRDAKEVANAAKATRFFRKSPELQAAAAMRDPNFPKPPPTQQAKPKASRPSFTIGDAAIIGGGTAAIGGGAYLLTRKKKEQSVQFAEVPLTGKLAADRYRKKIQDEDLDRRDANVLRSTVAGAGLGAALRGTMPARTRALIGAGAGAATAIGVRASTAGTKDIYGDRSRGAKQAEGAPWKIAGIGAIGMAGKRGYDKLVSAKIAASKLGRRAAGAGIAGLGLYAASRLFGSRQPIIQFDYLDKWIGGTNKSGGEIKVNYGRRVEDITRTSKRVSGALRDIGGRLKGQPALDARGRPRKEEWDKPYAKKLIATAIFGGGLLAANKIRKMPPGFGKGTAMRKIQEQVQARVPQKILRAKFPKTASAYDSVMNKIRGEKQAVTDEFAGAVGGGDKSILGRIAGYMESEHKKIGGATASAAATAKPVNISVMPGAASEKEIAKKIAEAQKAQVSEETAKKADDLKRKLFSAREELDRIISFGEDTVYEDKWEHWVRNRPGVIKRNREPKPWRKRSENQPLILAGTNALTAIGTMYAARKFAPEAFGKIARAAS